jgi:50S ribosomal protein L16 3-hydroxylase
MREYWHKRPLLIRNAIPSFALAKAQGQALQSPISAKVLFNYAGDGHSEARLVKAKPWQLEYGPFRKGQLPSLQSQDWTLLVQGVEARHPAAANVLSWFRFIPDARLDDLMISIAGVGGGVGPHVDSYDVFLIQMEGRRRWKISAQSDLSLRDDLPLKILSRFKAKEDWVLEPGDLLYLPPHIAHEGVALDAGCQTWSVGFRSPSYRELLQEGLWRLAESLEDDHHRQRGRQLLRAWLPS